MANRITSLCIDCTDAHLLAAFWCQVLDWQVTEDEDGVVRIQPAPDAREAIDFCPVPGRARRRPRTGCTSTSTPPTATRRPSWSGCWRSGARPVDIGQGAGQLARARRS